MVAQVEGQNVEDAQRVSKNPERTLDLFFCSLSWLLLNRKKKNIKPALLELVWTLSSAFHRVTSGGLQLVSWEVFAKLLLQEGVVANVPRSAAERNSMM